MPSADIKDAAVPGAIRHMEREQRTLCRARHAEEPGCVQMGGVRGRRKAVLLFSEGLEIPIGFKIYGVHTATDVLLGAINLRHHGGCAIPT